MSIRTVLITGGTGYIGAWITKMLLERGYHVRLAVRNKSNTAKTAPLEEIAKASNGDLSIWEADLMKPGSYDEAAKGADAIIHVASPFTLRFKNANKELIDPAVEGTRNVLHAADKASTVKKVVLTSSVAALYGDAIDMKEQGIDTFNEQHWNTSSSESHQPYSFSKVAAEKEAWDMAKAQRKWKLVVINPSFVMGPPLVPGSDSESLNLMKDMLAGKYATGAPELYFGFVDVRDVANAHVAALEKEDAEGRHLLAERVGTLLEVAQIIRTHYGDRFKLPKSNAPKWLLYLLGWAFGATIKFVKRNVGHPIQLDASKSRKALGLEYTPLSTAVIDMAEALSRK